LEINASFLFDLLTQVLGKKRRPQDEFVDFRVLKYELETNYLLYDVKCIFHDLYKVDLAVEYQISVVNCPKRIL
jgi:hypothetical protein